MRDGTERKEVLQINNKGSTKLAKDNTETSDDENEPDPDIDRSEPEPEFLTSEAWRFPDEFRGVDPPTSFRFHSLVLFEDGW